MNGVLQTGYSSPAYGASLSPFGTPIILNQSRVAFVKSTIPREIAPQGLFDLHGAYPYVTSLDWSAMPADLQEIAKSHRDVVSAVFVTDPFSDSTLERLDLQGCLEVMRPFKTHYVVRLGDGWLKSMRRTTRQYARRGIDAHDIVIRKASGTDMPEFWAHYENLIDRHQITGLPALSPEVVEASLSVPGAHIALAQGHDGSAASMIFYTDCNQVHPHLIGISKRGYKSFVSYALFHSLLTWAEENGFAHVNLGGVAGREDNPSNGLATFKRGWSNETRTTYLCGKILQEDHYQALSQRAFGGEDFFPAYRNRAGLTLIEGQAEA